MSIWRLTNKRQVWYEWYAEAFMPLPGSLSIPLSPPQNKMTLLVPALGQGIENSPLMDADVVADSDDVNGVHRAANGSGGDRVGLVKIGQTTLHNPRGRSSWIGL